MNTIITSVAGITFRLKDDPEVATLKPEGEVKLVPEPENEYDNKALAIYFNDKHIGYIPRKDDTIISEDYFSPQEWVHTQLNENKNLIAMVEEFKYFDEECGWNKECKGKLQHIKVRISNGSPEQITRKDGRFYTDEGNLKYESITSFLKTYPSDPEPLIRWCYQNFKTFDEYKLGLGRLADSGTDLHTLAEKALETGKEVGILGIDNFIKKFKPRLIQKEAKIFDNELMIAGTYDGLVEIEGKRVVLDWKSSKKVRDKHLIQSAFYAKNLNADEAWVVALGSTAAQGFSIGKADIQTEYKKLQLLKQFKTLCTTNKEYNG